MTGSIPQMQWLKRASIVFGGVFVLLSFWIAIRLSDTSEKQMGEIHREVALASARFWALRLDQEWTRSDFEQAFTRVKNEWLVDHSHPLEAWLCVLDADGNSLAETRYEGWRMRTSGDKVIPIMANSQVPIPKDLLLLEEDWTGITQDPSGEKRASAYVVLPHHQRIVALHIPQRHWAPLHGSPIQGWAMGFGLMTLGFFPAMIGILRWMCRKVEHSLHSEQQLLKDTSQELEQKVQLRTEELTRLNRQLESEVKERREMEKVLRNRESQLEESEERFRKLTHCGSVLIWMSDTSKQCTFFNQPWLDFRGRTPEEEKGYGWATGVHPDDVATCLETYETAFQKRRPFSMEYRLMRFDGMFRWMLDHGVPYFGHQGEFAGFIGSCIDITDRKDLESKNQAALQEKEILLKEIHHRVKNNLQIIDSLLRLQSRVRPEGTASEAITEVRNRIRALTLIHDQLHRSNNLTHIPFRRYVELLIQHIFEAYQVSGSKISARIFVEESIVLRLEIANPCGLIINELISNAIKHAFDSVPGTEPTGVITIQFFEVDDTYSLRVKDNGRGVSPEFHPSKSQTLGLRLVNLLVQQLEGKLDYASDQGADFKISFKRNSQPAFQA